MSSIVLKIPYESQSFHAALTDATLRDRVQEWVAAAVTLDDEVDQAQAALEMVGTFVPEEGA